MKKLLLWPFQRQGDEGAPEAVLVGPAVTSYLPSKRIDTRLIFIHVLNISNIAVQSPSRNALQGSWRSVDYGTPDAPKATESARRLASAAASDARMRCAMPATRRTQLASPVSQRRSTSATDSDRGQARRHCPPLFNMLARFTRAPPSRTLAPSKARRVRKCAATKVEDEGRGTNVGVFCSIDGTGKRLKDMRSLAEKESDFLEVWRTHVLRECSTAAREALSGALGCRASAYVSSRLSMCAVLRAVLGKSPRPVYRPCKRTTSMALPS
jgi:hypothetical protein